MAESQFAIQVRPTRRYPHSGGVEYEGKMLFRLVPATERPTETLEATLASVLDTGPYRYGDFFSLPMPLYLVRDEDTCDVFRVSIRDGVIRLHVLPETESAGLRAMYERLTERTDTNWHIEREMDRSDHSHA
ncbi:hypothetical protein ACFQJ7_14815 [Halovenus rubra]|uniref:Uncharacterized protein n=2 Tax=Halovenus rubra TaxID=869890 RepID=A0ABD5X7S7_9EURY|nr:hypothetical protein [Halovenus rubra]